ncbi:hypothetical protein GCM10020358_83750 [Amorphoplanes nipponensis]|uniref:Uncharacterized protein n=1 Tax=Actinoplanes nipponensis TaxID=135950 RepID=A0A919MLI2_9ACTN|nr:hypothetical protein Ani05nite_23510 [Actinoplanes nipponensis]
MADWSSRVCTVRTTASPERTSGPTLICRTSPAARTVRAGGLLAPVADVDDMTGAADVEAAPPGMPASSLQAATRTAIAPAATKASERRT